MRDVFIAATGEMGANMQYFRFRVSAAGHGLQYPGRQAISLQIYERRVLEIEYVSFGVILWLEA